MGVQQLYFEQFSEYRKILENSLGEKWNWQLQGYDENGKQISSIYKELNDVSIYKKEDWPAMISFFKPRIIALDDFWSSVKYSFEALRS